MRAPLRFAPRPLAVLDESFDHDSFIFESKYDGIRALAHHHSHAEQPVRAGTPPSTG